MLAEAAETGAESAETILEQSYR